MRRHALGARRVRHALLLLLVFVLLLASTSDSIRPAPDDVRAVHMQGGDTQAPPSQHVDDKNKNTAAGFLQEEVYATGSSLPDCSHACGPCKPCNRVMVSFKCSIAEPCPMVYRCMCKGKCYPVPSS